MKNILTGFSGPIFENGNISRTTDS